MRAVLSFARERRYAITSSTVINSLHGSAQLVSQAVVIRKSTLRTNLHLARIRPSDMHLSHISVSMVGLVGKAPFALRGEYSMANVKPIPEGYHSITPYLIIKGASAAIDFYKKAFGATEVLRMDGPNGQVMHAELQIGDS